MVVHALVEDPSIMLIGARPVEPHLLATIRAPDQWYSNGAATKCRAMELEDDMREEAEEAEPDEEFNDAIEV